MRTILTCTPLCTKLYCYVLILNLSKPDRSWFIDANDNWMLAFYLSCERFNNFKICLCFYYWLVMFLDVFFRTFSQYYLLSINSCWLSTKFIDVVYFVVKIFQNFDLGPFVCFSFSVFKVFILEMKVEGSGWEVCSIITFKCGYNFIIVV